MDTNYIRNRVREILLGKIAMGGLALEYGGRRMKTKKVKSGGTKSRWTDFVKKYANDHGISYYRALREARPSYYAKFG